MKDKAKVNEYNREYYSAHKEELLPKIRLRVKLWQRDNKERRNASIRAARANNQEAYRLNQWRSRIRLKATIILHYGGKCVCCGEDRLEFLTVDHIKGGGGKHRRSLEESGKKGSGDIYRWLKKNKYPSGFRILCFNCNSSTYYGNGICAHQRKVAWTAETALALLHEVAPPQKGNVKSYCLISPDGKLTQITNMRQFCQANNLNVTNMSAVVHNKQKSHKGWRLAANDYRSIQGRL